MPPPPPEARDAAEAHDIARAWAEEWAQRWFLDADGADRLRIGSIDAGWATHVEAFYLLLAFAQRHLAMAADRPSLATRVKGAGLDRLVRAVGLRVASVLDRPPAPTDAGLMCVLEIPTPSMSDGVIEIARAAGDDAITLAADHRAMRRAAAAGVATRPLHLSPPAQARLVRRGARAARAAFAAIERRPPVMELGGSDVAAAALVALRPMARRSAPWLLAEAAAIASALDRHRPRSLVVASDQHRIGRLAVAASRERDIRAITIQHGLPQQRVGLVPVVADTVAAWSPASRDWFVGHGTDPARIVITGNPRWRPSPRPERAPGAAASLLLALSPTAVEANRAVIRLVLDAAAASAAGGRPMDVVVKLHPGHRDWGWVDAEIAGAPGARTALAEPIEPLIRGADATILLRSTVAMDSLAAGTPVVLVRVAGGLSAADAELASLELPVADDPTALLSALAGLLDARGRSAYFDARRDELEAYLGPGFAAETIARLALDPNGG